MKPPTIDHMLDSFMDLGPDVAPLRIAQATHAAIRTTSQRRASWPARRFPTLNTYARLGLVAAAVLAVVIVGIGLFGKPSEVGPATSPTPSASSSPSFSPSPTAPPITGPIIGTWATGETTCAQQLAAIEAAGYSADQMTGVGVDLTCKNGIVLPGSGWSAPSQITIQFLPDGTLDLGRSSLAYRLIGDTKFEASDPTESVQGGCITYGYAIAGDQLSVEIIDYGCPATGEAFLLDQIALTVMFETSSFTLQP